MAAAVPAGARLAETVRYFEFISREMAGLLARWQAGAGTGAETESGVASVTHPGLPGAQNRYENS